MGIHRSERVRKMIRACFGDADRARVVLTRCEERRSGELTREEAVEPGREDEDDDPEDTPVGEVGLEPIIVSRFSTINALLLASIICG